MKYPIGSATTQGKYIHEIFTNLKIHFAIFFFAFLWLDKIRLLHVDVGYVGWLLGVPQFFLETTRVLQPKNG